MRKSWILTAAAVLIAAPALAQPPSPAIEATGAAALPPAARTKGAIVLRGGETVRYTAVAGALPALDANGVQRGEFSYVAYIAEGKDVATRPVTFVFNGGPLASSLSMEPAVGPKRLPPSGSSQPAALVDNAESWLDFTDLVFIDPMGTGWSHSSLPPAEQGKLFWGARQDSDSLSRAVKSWVLAERRWQSPKYLSGISYGGFRVPKMAKALGLIDTPVDGLIMMSPSLEMVSSRGGPGILEPMHYLPTYAAAAIERRTGKDVNPADLAEVEQYARGDYARDLMRGVNDKAAVARMVDGVVKYTGLDRSFVERLGGRIDPQSFAREFWRDQGKLGSGNDLMSTSFDPQPNVPGPAPYASAGSAGVNSMSDYVRNVLGWKVETPYNLRAAEAFRYWDWASQGYLTPELDASADLRLMLAVNAKFKVLIAQGATDTNTPYLNTRVTIDQIPDFGGQHRLAFKVYPGGHGFYSRESSRHMLHDDARDLVLRKIDQGE